VRLHLQRVSQARVTVGGAVVGEIGPGLLALAGFSRQDGPDLPGSALWNKMLAKTVDLRIFPDADDKLNLSLVEHGGGLLVVSQFTLYADCKKGRRPSFHLAADGADALGLYNRLLKDFQALLPGRVQGGAFGEMMDVALTNWGPVTILLDSAEL